MVNHKISSHFNLHIKILTSKKIIIFVISEVKYFPMLVFVYDY